MLNNQHFVEELFFDISFPTEDEAFSQQALLGEFVSDTLAGEVDAVFGDCSMVDSVLRIDRLEVDLGTVPYQNYQAELTERLGKRLRERLRDYQAIAHTKNGAGVTVVARGIAELETCQYFVRYGYLPWHCRTESELAVSQMFLRVIESQCSAVIKMLSSVQLPDVALARLADVVPLNGLITIARQLLHGEFNTVARLLNNLSEGQVLHGWFGRVSRKNANDCMRDLWRGVIGTLLYLGSNGGAGVIVGAVILKHCDRQGRTRLRKVRKFLCELKGYDARHQEVNTALYDVINVLDISIADNLGVDRELKAETPLSVQQDEIERMMPAMLAEWIENADPAGLKKIAAQWDIVLEKYSVLLKGLVRAHGRKTETRNVLVQLFSSSQLCDLIGLIDPPAQRFVLDTVIFFEENTLSTKSFNVTRFSMLGNFSDLNDEKNLWRFTFYFILVERGNRFNKRQYCRSLLREIAAHENFSYGELLDDLQQWLSSVTERNRYAGELLLIINELVDDQGQDNVSPCLPLATSPDGEIERVTPVVLAEWIKNADSSGLKKIAAQWDIILERHSVLLENLVRVHGRKAETRGVLAQLLSPGQLCDLIGLIDPLAQRFVQDTIVFFTGSMSSTNRSNVRDFSGLSDEQNLWNFTFYFIFVEGGNRFNKRQYCRSLLREIAAHENFSYGELLDDLQQWLSSVTERNRYAGELLLIINELVDDQGQDNVSPYLPLATSPDDEIERVTPIVLAEWIKNADSSGLKKIAAQWDIILERHSVLLENLVRVHGRKAETRSVLAQLLSPGQLGDLIGLIDPLAQRFVQDTIIFFTGSVSSTNRSNIRDFSELSDEQNLWNFTFDFIFVERGNWFNKRLYCGNLLRGMAAHNNFSYHELLDDLQQWLSAVVKRNRYVDELLLIINELVEDQSRSDLLPHCSSVTTPTIEVSELVDEQMDNLRLTRGAAADTDTPGSIDNSIQSSFRDVLDSSAAVYLENAGQVLLAPYLPSLFERLGLLKGGQFNDHRASERAVHVLQYMVDGIGAAPEYMMVLNKLICGVSSARPITRDIIVSDTDKVFIDGLLVAAIENWKGIGNTSVDGLRQSFLQREGKLQLKDEQWQLLVAPRSYDMLLDKLPWSYSTIKYSWMPRVIHVEWR